MPLAIGQCATEIFTMHVEGAQRLDGGNCENHFIMFGNMLKEKKILWDCRVKEGDIMVSLWEFLQFSSVFMGAMLHLKLYVLTRHWNCSCVNSHTTICDSMKSDELPGGAL
jgi:hypothetical protein